MTFSPEVVVARPGGGAGGRPGRDAAGVVWRLAPRHCRSRQPTAATPSRATLKNFRLVCIRCAPSRGSRLLSTMSTCLLGKGRRRQASAVGMSRMAHGEWLGPEEPNRGSGRRPHRLELRASPYISRGLSPAVRRAVARRASWRCDRAGMPTCDGPPGYPAIS